MAALPTMRTLALRTRARMSSSITRTSAPIVCQRHYANENANNHSKLPEAQPGESGPNMGQAEHVSEEAAKMAKVMGEKGPDIDQGTPVQDILNAEKDIRKTAPQVMKDQLKNSKPSGTRSFSTMTRRGLQVVESGSVPEPDLAMLSNEAQRAQFEFGNSTNQLSTRSSPTEAIGHKFPLPQLPLPRSSVKSKRYESIVEQLTGLIMKHGKKATAQRNVAIILNDLRTNPAPKYDPKLPLLPGAPPASHLPLYPILYLTLAIDSIAPLLRIRSQRGAAGGGMALQIPVPLRERQRRRIAINWILDVVSKKKSRTSGNDMFPHRLAEEIVAVIEGRSTVWAKRAAIHRLATTSRMNVNFNGTSRRRF